VISLSEDTDLPSFSELGLAAPVLAALADVGYESPSPIQAKTIPIILEGVDLIGQASTGTGKTAAFALPVLSKIDISLNAPQALVLTPTRELAIQVAEAFQKYAAKMPGFHVLPIYGGQSYTPQLKGLKRGSHVIVGTPGRLLDHVQSGALKLDQLRFIVLDEGDEMLQMGFVDDIEFLLSQAPQEKQVALFSATLPAAIRRIAERHMKTPREIVIQSRGASAPKIRQRMWMVSGLHKLDALTRLLEVETFDAMLVFVRTKVETLDLAQRLEARGFSASALNGDLEQRQRENIVKQLKDGKIDIVIATDVAARGLDVERISHVVNYDIPYDSETYIHRIGRTGRAGRSGEAILFVSPRERNMLRVIERVTKQRIEEMKMPSVADVNELRLVRFKEKISEAVLSGAGKEYQPLLEQLESDGNIPAIEIAAALASMMHGTAPLLLTAKAEAEPAPATKVDTSAPRATYRIDVGHAHGVLPGNIVGAIANEAGVEGKFIGHIDIRDDHSFVELPTLPDGIVAQLQNVRVKGALLAITRVTEKPPKPAFDGRSRRPQGREGRPENREFDRPRPPREFQPRERPPREFDRERPPREAADSAPPAPPAEFSRDAPRDGAERPPRRPYLGGGNRFDKAGESRPFRSARSESRDYRGPGGPGGPGGFGGARKPRFEGKPKFEGKPTGFKKKFTGKPTTFKKPPKKTRAD
jgi:ATP-dependent RNA helicase DeaD